MSGWDLDETGLPVSITDRWTYVRWWKGRGYGQTHVHILAGRTTLCGRTPPDKREEHTRGDVVELSWPWCVVCRRIEAEHLRAEEGAA